MSDSELPSPTAQGRGTGCMGPCRAWSATWRHVVSDVSPTRGCRVTPGSPGEAGMQSPEPGVHIKYSCVWLAAVRTDTGARTGMGLWERIFIKWLFPVFHLQQTHLALICLVWRSPWGDAFHCAGLQEQRKRALLQDSSVCDSTQKADLHGAGDELGWVARTLRAGRSLVAAEGRAKKPAHLPCGSRGWPTSSSSSQGCCTFHSP